MNPTQKNKFKLLSAWRRKPTISPVIATTWKTGLTLCGLAALLATQPVAAATVSRAVSQPCLKVFILAGQSNMEGYGGLQTLDELGDHPTRGGLLKKIRKTDGSFVTRDDVFL
jgi:hypothetical protein